MVLKRSQAFLQCSDASSRAAKLLHTSSAPWLLLEFDSAKAMNHRRRSTRAAASESNVPETPSETASRRYRSLESGKRRLEIGYGPFRNNSKQSTNPAAVETSISTSADAPILSSFVSVSAKSCTP